MAGEVPRRDFVKGAAAAMALGGPAVLAACGGGKGGGLLGNRSSSATDSSTASSSRSDSSSRSRSETESSSGSGGGRPTGQPNVFRRSTRHVNKPCNACVAHAKNRFYKTAEAAAADPAHKGCRCSVRGQVIPDSQLASMFSGSKTAFDKRSG
jgi:hypothetical protein